MDPSTAWKAPQYYPRSSKTDKMASVTVRSRAALSGNECVVILPHANQLAFVWSPGGSDGLCLHVAHARTAAFIMCLLVAGDNCATPCFVCLGR